MFLVLSTLLPSVFGSIVAKGAGQQPDIGVGGVEDAVTVRGIQRGLEAFWVVRRVQSPFGGPQNL